MPSRPKCSTSSAGFAGAIEPGEVRKGGEAPLRVTYRAITRRNSVMEGKRIMGLWRFSSPIVVTVPP